MYNETQCDNNLQKIWSIIGPQQNRTKGPFHRIRNAYNSSKYCIDNNISGDFLEFGVWKGGIIGCMSILAQQENKKERRLYKGRTRKRRNRKLTTTIKFAD